MGMIEVGSRGIGFPGVCIRGSCLDDCLRDTGDAVSPWSAELSNTVEVDAGHIGAVVDDGEVDDVADLQVKRWAWEGTINEESIPGESLVAVTGAPGDIDGKGFMACGGATS